MKNIFKIMALTIAVCILFTSCCKDNRTAESYFYVNQPASPNTFKLFIDDQYRGELPFINIGSTCENNYIKLNALHIIITEKHYKVEARDSLGTILASESIDLRLHANDLSNSIGDIGVARSAGVVIVNFGTMAEAQH